MWYVMCSLLKCSYWYRHVDGRRFSPQIICKLKADLFISLLPLAFIATLDSVLMGPLTFFPLFCPSPPFWFSPLPLLIFRLFVAFIMWACVVCGWWNEAAFKVQGGVCSDTLGSSLSAKRHAPCTENSPFLPFHIQSSQALTNPKLRFSFTDSTSSRLCDAQRAKVHVTTECVNLNGASDPNSLLSQLVAWPYHFLLLWK